MSTYKFSINKRPIMERDDSSQYAPAPETFEDSTQEINANRDIDVSVYLDDVLKHTVTLTDAGATLQFDADISTGDHVIKICAPKSPIQQTDICVDQFSIGSDLCVASQWDFNNQVFGTASTLRQKIASHNHVPHDYVWWGRMVNNDSSLNLNEVFYRPGIVSEHQGEWHMDFTKTADGKIWITKTGDTDHILWDSTAQHTYYFVAQGTDQSTVDAAYTTYQNNVDTTAFDFASGTIACSSSSTTVTGDASEFVKTVEVGDHIVVSGESIGTVASITSDTELVLDANASTSHSAGSEYSIFSPDIWSTVSVTQHQLDIEKYQGPGTYAVNGNYLEHQSTSIDDNGEDADNMVIITLAEFQEKMKQLWYHNNYTVTPITVS